MDNNVRSTIAENDEVIDLKELVLYILRRWRVLIVLGVIGVLLGGCYGFLKPEKTLEDLDLDTLQYKEIEQYARYQQMYEDQLAWEQESVYLNLDPADTCYASKTYLMRVNETDLPVIGEKYRSILREDEVYYGLIEASGIDCSLRAIKQLASISFSKLEEEDEPVLILARQKRSVEVKIQTVAPDEENCQGMLAYLDKQVQAMNEQIDAEYEITSCEVLSENSGRGYVAAIETAQKDSTEKLAEYVTKLTALKKTLTDDDLIYYAEVYTDEAPEAEEEETSLSWLKWAIIIGVVFGFLGVCVYGVLFLVDGHIKTADELLAYGLHPFALMADEQAKRKKNPIDRLLTPKKRVNDADYLTQALKSLKLEHIMLSGSTEDQSVTALLSGMKAKDGSVLTGAMLSEDAAAQETAAQADGVVLVVHLWKTRRDDLEQEIRICQKLGYPVLGAVVII